MHVLFGLVVLLVASPLMNSNVPFVTSLARAQENGLQPIREMITFRQHRDLEDRKEISGTLEIPFNQTLAVGDIDPANIAVTLFAVDPATRERKTYINRLIERDGLPGASINEANNSLVLNLRIVPFRRVTQVDIRPGTLITQSGETSAEISFRSPVGLHRSQIPSVLQPLHVNDITLFTPFSFPDSPLLDLVTEPPIDVEGRFVELMMSALRREKKAREHLQLLTNFLFPNENRDIEESLLHDIFNHEQLIEVFANENLRAAFLYGLGMPGHGAAIDLILTGGDNDSGKPPQFQFSPLSGITAMSQVGEDWIITFNEIFVHEDFRDLTPTVRHELFHSDDRQAGQDEEVIIAGMTELDWIQIILRDSNVVTIKTPLVTIRNERILAFLHSGEPGRPGIQRQNQLQDPPQIYPARNGGFVDAENRRTESLELSTRTEVLNHFLGNVP